MGASHIDLWRPLLKERRFAINRSTNTPTSRRNTTWSIPSSSFVIRTIDVPGQHPEFLRIQNDIAEGDRDILWLPKGQGA